MKKSKPKDTVITTVEMELAITKLFNYRRYIIVPNLSWGFVSHECDMFLIKKSGYAVEVEIKRSVSDFRADFKKGHNHKERNNKITEFYYAFPESIYEKCKDSVPEHAGIIVCRRYDTAYRPDRVYACIEKHPEKIKNSRKLTVEEQLKVAHLGTMRIWSLKEKLLIYSKKNGITKNTEVQ